MRIDDIQQRLRSQGGGSRHIDRVMRDWAHGRSPCAGRTDDFLPRRVREGLPDLEADLQALARLRALHPAPDGSARLLIGLHDGQTVEAVLLPRRGLCVSSQVGCAVGCAFCMTGQTGLQRQLGSAEMVAQVALGRRLRAVRKVVFMGMGEPAHNLEAVLEAIELLGTHGGIGHKSLVFSTVGDRRVFERLAQGRVRPALALSLHSTDPGLRRRLLPRAPSIDPVELVELGERYARDTGYPIQYQWTLLDGINDGQDEVEGIVRLLCGKYAIMNLIAYNPVDGVAFRRPTAERTTEMLRALNDRGVLTKLRQSAGQDVEGGCGQLRARALGPAERPVTLRFSPKAAPSGREVRVEQRELPGRTSAQALRVVS